MLTARESVAALQSRADLSLVKGASKASYAFKDLGERLAAAEFEASALEGRAKVVVDGHQRLRRVDITGGAAADGQFAEALLAAMQEAHDTSVAASKGDVWDLYKHNGVLLQAPLTQIGAGATADDLWANVIRTEETLRMAKELFTTFDEDKDGYWNLNETSTVQLATEGTDMAEEAFNALIIAAAPNGGRQLSEEDLKKGLSEQQVIELYTDADRQRALGFVLDITKDYAAVLARNAAQEEPAAPVPAPPAVD